MAFDGDRVLLANVIKAACQNARQAIGGSNVYLFADIGPIAQQEESNLFDQYQTVIDLFLKQNVPYFLFETFSSSRCV